MPLALVSQLSYFALFVVMIIEGPVVTSAAAFAARFGVFSVWVVFFLSIAGDIVGDFIYYGVGWASRKTLIDNHGHKFGLDQEKMARIDVAFKKHKYKTLIISKLVPALPGPVLIAAGALDMPFWTLLWLSAAMAAPKYALFALIGYEFGDLYTKFFHYYDVVGWIVAAVVIVGSYIAYKKSLKAIFKDTEL
ncbi:MAG: VTT domain-containing protein [Patescibacteria group bacterium]|nr:VTT domain-containing protein [Patescibacteria group bacterium]MDE2116314.1 VTT domain-containing protein [Patescibacteria group bacterium]